jgi:hypothetical protein
MVIQTWHRRRVYRLFSYFLLVRDRYGPDRLLTHGLSKTTPKWVRRCGGNGAVLEVRLEFGIAWRAISSFHREGPGGMACAWDVCWFCPVFWDLTSAEHGIVYSSESVLSLCVVQLKRPLLNSQFLDFLYASLSGQSRQQGVSRLPTESSDAALLPLVSWSVQNRLILAAAALAHY